MTTSDRNISIVVSVIALIIVGAALHELQSEILPFVVAVFLANIFRPLIAFLRGHKVPLAVAMLLVVVLVGGVFFGVGVVAVSSVQSLIAAVPRYASRWNDSLLPTVERLLQHAPADMQAQIKNLQWKNIVEGSAVFGLLSTAAGSLMQFLSGVVLILLFMLFILMGNGSLANKVGAAYPEARAKEIVATMQKVDKKMNRYLLTVILLNLASGTLTAIILALFGVDLAILWGLFTFLVCFIPTIGSIVAAVLPIAVAFLQFDALGTPIAVAITLVVLQFMLGSVLTPKIMGSSLNLSPLLVLVALIFWGWVWGPWGMVLSVPIMSAIKIILESRPRTKPLAVLMCSDPSIVEKD